MEPLDWTQIIITQYHFTKWYLITKAICRFIWINCIFIFFWWWIFSGYLRCSGRCCRRRCYSSCLVSSSTSSASFAFLFLTSTWGKWGIITGFLGTNILNFFIPVVDFFCVAEIGVVCELLKVCSVGVVGSITATFVEFSDGSVSWRVRRARFDWRSLFWLLALVAIGITLFAGGWDSLGSLSISSLPKSKRRGYVLH